MNPCFEAGIHDGQVLIRERHIDNQFGLELTDEFHRFSHIVGVHAGGFYFLAAIGSVNGISDGIALGFGA